MLGSDKVCVPKSKPVRNRGVNLSREQHLILDPTALSLNGRSIHTRKCIIAPKGGIGVFRDMDPIIFKRILDSSSEEKIQRILHPPIAGLQLDTAKSAN